ncbi:MAG: hypothetical protein ACI37S_05670 [Candidatus Gastranaerophilaceae bacterium]
MTTINEIKFNDEAIYYIKNSETLLISLNAMNVVFGITEKDMNDQIKENIVIIENKKFCDYNIILNLSKKYQIKNNQILSKLQTLKNQNSKFYESDEIFTESAKNISYAIENKFCLKIKYENNNERIVEPHSIGKLKKSGNIALYAYQIAGYSSSGTNSKAFRLFHLNKIHNIEILENEHFKIRWQKGTYHESKNFIYEIKRVEW